MRYRDDDYTGRFIPIPIGHYQFQFLDVPKGKEYQTKRGKGLNFKLHLRAVSDDGNTREFKTSCPSYVASQIWRALGYNKTEDGEWAVDEFEFSGKKFEADIIHEKDKNDPNKVWPKIDNVVIPEEYMEEPKEEESEPEQETELPPEPKPGSRVGNEPIKVPFEDGDPGPGEEDPGGEEDDLPF